MSEVKVKITAQNQTQTGFQAVLTDAKRTAAQVQQTFSTTTAAPLARQRPAVKPFEIGDVLAEGARKSYDAQRGALEDMLGDLRRAREQAKQTVAEVEQIPSSGRGGLFGRILGAAGTGVGFGLLIKSQIEQVADSFNGLIDKTEEFSKSIANISQASTLQDIESGVAALSSGLESLRQANDQFSSSWQNKIVNAFTEATAALKPFEEGITRIAGAIPGLQAVGPMLQLSPNAGLFQTQNNLFQTAQSEARSQILSGIINATRLQNQIGNAGSLFEVQAINDKNQRQTIEDSLAKIIGDPAKAKSLLDGFYNATRKAKENIESLERPSGTRKGDVIGKQLGPGNVQGIRDFERQQEAARRALGPEFGPGTAEAALGGFRVDAADFARKQQEELLRQASAKSQITGSLEASQLQRIGFASNEFFDTRRALGPAEIVEAIKRNAAFTKEVADILKKGEPLVLPATN